MKSLTFCTVACLLLMLLLLVSGCADQTELNSTISNSTSDEGYDSSPDVTERSDEDSHADDKQNNPTQISSSVEDKTEIEVENETVSSPAQTHEDSSEGSATNPEQDGEQSDRSKQSDQVTHYHPSEPRLVGLMIDQSKEQVISQYGEPLNIYTIDAELNPIEIYIYEGFQVGFDQEQTILFVEVTSPDVQPGLNGLHLGDPRSKIIELLGTPTSQTEFVVSYISNEVVLKLDIDPVEDKILSIKLFANE